MTKKREYVIIVLMATSTSIRTRIKNLKKEFDRLKRGKETLLNLLDEAEIPEMVYNSNAIENSTLTLKETEKILLNMQVSSNVSLREVFEAKNLARVIEYIRNKAKAKDLSKNLILLLHQMLIDNIDVSISGKFRKKGEYVRIGTFIAVPPEHIKSRLAEIFLSYSSDFETYFIDKIAKFHLEFENIHPFNDGNGRIGRVIINYQLLRLEFPGLIIRNKEKQKYYASFKIYQDNKNPKPMEQILGLGLIESLHKRIAYLKGTNIIRLSEYAKQQNKSLSALLNSAKRQTIPAFREKGVWKIGID